MGDFLCIKLDDDGDNADVIQFVDEKVMDPSRIEQMGKELLSLADSEGKKNLVINFENVRFFSSQAINKLIVLERRLKANGRQIHLSNLRPEVRDLFSYTNLDSVFKIHDLLDDALESIN